MEKNDAFDQKEYLTCLKKIDSLLDKIDPLKILHVKLDNFQYQDVRKDNRRMVHAVQQILCEQNVSFLKIYQIELMKNIVEYGDMIRLNHNRAINVKLKDLIETLIQKNLQKEPSFMNQDSPLNSKTRTKSL